MSFLESLRVRSPRRQLLLAAVAVLGIGAVLTAAYFVVLRKPYDVLFSNLRTMDAATIVADLEKKKIPYRLGAGGATILVPSDLRDGARLSVVSEDLPLKGTVGFELFNKSDMGLTEFAQKINYQRALQGELARTIMSMDTVDTARVHLAMTDETIFRDDRRPSKASVTVQPRPGKELSDGTVRGIQRLIAAAVPDLAVADVVVLDEHGKIVSNDLPPEAAAQPQVQERQAIEQYYSARIRRVLAKAYPNGAEMTVTVSAVPPPSHAGGDIVLETWSPGTRSFPLSVAITAAALPSQQLQNDIKALAGQAIGLDPAKGDVLNLSAAVQPWVSPDAAPARAAIALASPTAIDLGKSAPGPSAALSWAIYLAPILLLLIGAAIYLHRRRTLRRGLTAEQRSDYARRLQTLLDQRDARVPSSI